MMRQGRKGWKKKGEHKYEESPKLKMWGCDEDDTGKKFEKYNKITKIPRRLRRDILVGN